MSISSVLESDFAVGSFHMAAAESVIVCTNGVQAWSSSLISAVCQAAACGSLRARLLALCRPAGHTFTRGNRSLHDSGRLEQSLPVTDRESVSQWRSAVNNLGVCLSLAHWCSRRMSPAVTDCYDRWKVEYHRGRAWQTLDKHDYSKVD